MIDGRDVGPPVGGSSGFNLFKSLPRWAWVVVAVLAVVALLVLLFFARGLVAVFSAYWSFGGIKRVLYQDLGLSDALSSLLATALAFIEGLVWLPVIAWPFRLLRMKFTLRQAAIAFGCWVVAYGTIPVLHAAFGRDVCFNQATGTPEKWYVIRDGKVILFDSAGFDSFGVKKQVVTPDICRTHMQQDHGVRAKAITDPPNTVQFFDSSTGLAKVWYDVGADGIVHLFDGPGYDPATGTLLQPVTKDVVAEVLAQSRIIAASAAPPPAPPVASAPAMTSTQPELVSSSTVICGQPVSYVVDGAGAVEPFKSFLGVWTGAAWNSRVCGGLVVSRVSPDGSADVAYVYGPLPGTQFPWKAQHLAASISDGQLAFTDEEGGRYTFRLDQPSILRGHFVNLRGAALDSVLSRDASSIPQ